MDKELKMKVVLMGVEVELKKGALWKVPLVLVMMVVGLTAWFYVVMYSWEFFLQIVDKFK